QEKLVFIASSLSNDQGNLSGGMLLGPIIMGDIEDTVSMSENESLKEGLKYLPAWDTKKVHHSEEILSCITDSLSAGSHSLYGSFVFEQDKLLSDLYKMKDEWQLGTTDCSFLIRSEKQINDLIAAQDKEGAQQLLNELLGYIYFTGESDIVVIKARLLELLVLLSRAAIDAGADIQEILLFSEENIKRIAKFSSLEEMSIWITGIMHRFIQYSFDFTEVRHSDILHKTMQYVKANYNQKITLDDVAAHVYLSRSYISSIFKEEMGETLFSYINRVRVEKSKTLLTNENVSLADVAGLCGFEDQSYFSKVFKSLTGVSPKKYRDKRGKL
ncbi:MAG: AraC family transcriptional regulator, partial [Oscillospiraceae bacterium]